MGQRQGPSNSDVVRLNRLYRCSGEATFTDVPTPAPVAPRTTVGGCACRRSWRLTLNGQLLEATNFCSSEPLPEPLAAFTGEYCLKEDEGCGEPLRSGRAAIASFGECAPVEPATLAPAPPSPTPTTQAPALTVAPTPPPSEPAVGVGGA